MTTLRGLTWHHPRATDSIRAASAAFSRSRPGITVEWTSRPLHEFESAPLDELTADFDILSIDHPFVGDGAASGTLAPLGDVIDAASLAARASAYVGPSYESYQWAGRLWALPVDAACMVTAHRDVLLSQEVPSDWESVVPFLRELGRERAVIAANPTHLWGTFLSMCEAVDGGTIGAPSTSTPRWWRGSGIDEDVAEAALRLLHEVVAACAGRSLRMDPIDVLDELAGAGTAVYTPLVFGYSTYALRREPSEVVRFVNAPTSAGRPNGTLTGGVGLAISGPSDHRREAADFVLFATSPEVQKGPYARAGGQPASTAAWHDAEVDEHSHGFFRGTLPTMNRSFLRPRRPGYPHYQRTAARVLHEMFQARESTGRILSTLNGMWADVASR